MSEIETLIAGRARYQMTKEEAEAVDALVEPKWKAFAAEYEALLEKYDVQLDFGCGCCQDGHRMDGWKVDDYKWGRV